LLIAPVAAEKTRGAEIKIGGNVTMDTAALIIRIALMLISVLLVVVVLLQKTKSSGLGSSFGGETTSFTQKGKAASREAKLQKLTIILAIIVGVLALVLTIF
jgi:preprotein translocase subunit SecG